QNEAMLSTQGRAVDWNHFYAGLSRTARLTIQLAIIGLGAYLTLGNGLTGGGMIAASLLLGRALSPMEPSIRSWRALVAARNARQRLLSAVDRLPAPQLTVELPAPVGKLAAENVFYVPPGQSKPILKGVSFEMAAGEMVGIIGPSAAGKTTLGRLLVGTARPS